MTVADEVSYDAKKWLKAWRSMAPRPFVQMTERVLHASRIGGAVAWALARRIALAHAMLIAVAVGLSTPAVMANEWQEEMERQLEGAKAWHLCAPEAEAELEKANVLAPDLASIVMSIHAAGDPPCPVFLALEGVHHYRSGNYFLAERVLKLAARLGSINARAFLGDLYRFGRGVGKDPIEAYKWYALAAESGLAFAAEERDDLGWQRKVTATDIAEAERRMVAWRERLPEPRRSSRTMSFADAVDLWQRLVRLRTQVDGDVLSRAEIDAEADRIYHTARGGNRVIDMIVATVPREMAADHADADACLEAGEDPMLCDEISDPYNWMPSAPRCDNTSRLLSEMDWVGWRLPSKLLFYNERCRGAGLAFYDRP